MYRNLILFTSILLIFACSETDQKRSNFNGEPNAVDLADKMFDAIGGKQGWCDLRSLYIKAEHSEPQMEIPYQSEIWRGIDTFQLVIEQQNDSFHVKGIFTEEGGTIHYLDARDTFRILTADQLENWTYDNKHNVYVLLHDLGCNPSNYRVQQDDDNTISFYQDTVLQVRFGLDSLYRPHLFYRPNPDGSTSGSRFSHWGTDSGLTHSAGGHPLDSSFMYLTSSWQASSLSLTEAFGSDIFSIE